MHANEFTEINYGTMVYMKTALIMDHLMAYLGEETMDKCMHAYYEEWKFKHRSRRICGRCSSGRAGRIWGGCLMA